MLTDFQPVNAVRDLAVFARLFYAGQPSAADTLVTLPLAVTSGMLRERLVREKN